MSISVLAVSKMVPFLLESRRAELDMAPMSLDIRPNRISFMRFFRPLWAMWKVERGRRLLSFGTSPCGEAALTQAEQFLRAALTVQMLEGATERWAQTSLTLATVHDRLAERDGNLFHLEASVAITRDVLLRYPVTGGRQLRASLQSSLGTALIRMAERNGSDECLNEAVAILHVAIASLPDSRDDRLRSVLQAGLGTALVRIGERTADITPLKRAVIILEEALSNCSRKAYPENWSSIRNVLSTAQIRLGEKKGDRQGDRLLLEQALAGLRLALENRRRDKAPIAWAATMTDMGNCLVRLGELESGTRHYEEALGCFREALGEVTFDQSPRDFAEAQNNIGVTLHRLAERSGEVAHMFEALEALSYAAIGAPRHEAQLDWAVVQNSRAQVLIQLGRMTGDADHIRLAADAAHAALSVFSPDFVPDAWAAACGIRDEAERFLGVRELELQD
jgi:tetratricopeptide (TPR) repeat protein